MDVSIFLEHVFNRKGTFWETYYQEFGPRVIDTSSTRRVLVRVVKKRSGSWPRSIDMSSTSKVRLQEICSEIWPDLFRRVYFWTCVCFCFACVSQQHLPAVGRPVMWSMGKSSVAKVGLLEPRLPTKMEVGRAVM